MMFHAKKDYAYDNIDSAKVDQFIVKPGDYILIRVFSNNGYQLVDVKSYVNFTYDALSIPYVVQKSGFVALPLLDTIYVKGLTIPQLETKLSMLYSDYFVNPFVMVNITNNQVVVFNGRGESTVVPFTDNDMTLIQAISAANGIEKNAKAYRIKLIRGNGAEQKVYLINLRYSEDTKYAKLDLAPDDIIYIEPAFDANDFFSQIIPFVSLASTAALIAFNLTLIKRSR